LHIQQVINKNYKYPFVSSEILSHDLPFIVEKFFPLASNNINVSNYSDTLICENSITNNSVNDDLIDEIIEETQVIKKLQFNPPEVEYNSGSEKDKDISLNASLDKKNMFTSRFEDNYYTLNYELLDYMFNTLWQYENKITDVQGSYFVKVIQSFMRLPNNKGYLIIKYMCYKRKDILFKIINGIQMDFNRKIILELLLYTYPYDNANNEDDNINTSILGIDNIKTQCLLVLINVFKDEIIEDYVYKEICLLLCEYIDFSKTCCDYLVNDVFLNSVINVFETITSIKNENIIQRTYMKLVQIFVFLSRLIREYKIEYDRSQKFISSLSRSHMKMTTTEKMSDKTILLSLDNDNIMCNKIGIMLNNMNLYYNTYQHIPNEFLIYFIEFIYELIQITRNKQLLDILNKNLFFNVTVFYYFRLKNDTFQYYVNGIIRILLDETNEKWFQSMLITSNMLNEIFKMKIHFKEDHILYVHIAKLLEMITNSLLSTSSTSIKGIGAQYKENILSLYKELYYEYVERMNKPLAGFKSNYLYIMNETEIKNVDEIDIVEDGKVGTGHEGSGGIGGSENKKVSPIAKKSRFVELQHNEFIINEDNDDSNSDGGDNKLNIHLANCIDNNNNNNNNSENENIGELMFKNIINEDTVDTYYYDNNYWNVQTFSNINDISIEE
jgi:hypothetical protein